MFAPAGDRVPPIWSDPRSGSGGSDQRRILLCDSESQSLRALRVVLHGAGFDVDATCTAAEALDHGALSLPEAAIIELVARLLANLRRTEPAGQEPCVELDGLEINLAARSAPRRQRDPPHTDRVQPPWGLDSQSRTAAQPRRAATPGLGPGVYRRPTDTARAHREPATQDRAGRRRAPHPHRPRSRVPLGRRAPRPAAWARAPAATRAGQGSPPQMWRVRRLGARAVSVGGET